MRHRGDGDTLGNCATDLSEGIKTKGKSDFVGNLEKEDICRGRSKTDPSKEKQGNSPDSKPWGVCKKDTRRDRGSSQSLKPQIQKQMPDCWHPASNEHNCYNN